jgi:hypothetical protein
MDGDESEGKRCGKVVVGMWWKCQVMSFSGVEYVETTEIGVCGEKLQKLRT